MKFRPTHVAAGALAGVVGLTAAWGISLAQTGDSPAAVHPVAAGVARLMAYDADGDRRLTAAELTDARLTPLFKRADTNQDGAVTAEELSAQLHRELELIPVGRSGRPGGPGPGAPPPPPPLGQILPGPVLDELDLSPQQRQQLRELQVEVDAKLRGILSEEQQRRLRQLRERGPGQPGGPPPGAGPGGPPGGRPRQ